MRKEDSVRNAAILVRIEMMMPSLSKAEKKVADYIYHHPEKIIGLTVAGLSDFSSVSEATVIRACRSLGYKSYQDLKIALAQEMVSPLKTIRTEINDTDDVPTVINKIFSENINTLRYTRSTIQDSSLQTAADMLMKAGQVLIFGFGNSHAIGIDLEHKLLRLGIKAYAYSDSHFMDISAVNCEKGDVVFAISHSGSTRDLADSVRICRRNGARVISLTNIGRSPLGKLSDVVLTTASKETQFHIVSISSRIAQLTVIDCLYTLIALQIPNINKRFYEIDRALERKKY